MKNRADLNTADLDIHKGLVNTLALLTLAGCILWRMQIRQWARLNEKEPFVALPEVPAPTIISDLDPRTEVNKEYDLGPDKIDY